MSRISSLVLPAALFCVAVTGAVQGQGRQGGGRGQQAAALPDGAGREMVQGMCSACHGVNMITGSTGYTQERWADQISTMVKLPDPQRTTITQYLAAPFPPKPGREPVLVPGPVQITFKEWIAPTLGQRARDPLQLADGTIYWTGQFAQRGRTPEPPHRRDEGMEARSRGPSAQPHQRSRGQHLVHGQRERNNRAAESRDRRDQGLPVGGSASRNPPYC